MTQFIYIWAGNESKYVNADHVVEIEVTKHRNETFAKGYQRVMLLTLSDGSTYRCDPDTLGTMIHQMIPCPSDMDLLEAYCDEENKWSCSVEPLLAFAVMMDGTLHPVSTSFDPMYARLHDRRVYRRKGSEVLYEVGEGGTYESTENWLERLEEHRVEMEKDRKARDRIKRAKEKQQKKDDEI